MVSEKYAEFLKKTFMGPIKMSDPGVPNNYNRSPMRFDLISLFLGVNIYYYLGNYKNCFY